LVKRLAATQWRLSYIFATKAGITSNRLREIAEECAESEKHYLRKKEIAEFQNHPTPLLRLTRATSWPTPSDADSEPNSLAKLAQRRG
jgi:hypothetical protein